MSTTPVTRQSQLDSLTRVQRRVGAIGFFSVVVHGVFGLIGAAAAIVDQAGRRGDAGALVIMSGMIAIVTVVVTRLILGARLFSPLWLLVGLIPSVAGWFWVMGG